MIPDWHNIVEAWQRAEAETLARAVTSCPLRVRVAPPVSLCTCGDPRDCHRGGIGECFNCGCMRFEEL